MKSKKTTPNQFIKNSILPILLICIVSGLLTYSNLLYANQEPGGTDFLYRWKPTRLLLFDGYKNPYSPEVEYQVELIHHGHAHQGEETPGIFAYPYYIIPLFIPFSLIENFNLARAVWMTVLELVQMSLVVLTLRLFKLKFRKSILILLLVFSLFCSYFTQPLIDGNPSPIVALFILLSLISISKGKDWQAGIFLALSTIKPQLVILVFILIWLWAFSHRRWKIIIGSLLSLVILMGVSFAIQPSWFSEFLADVFLYPSVASPHSPQTIMNAWFPGAAKWISLGLSVVVAIILGREWIRSYRKDFDVLFWTVCLTFTLMPLSGITSAKSNFIAMIPGFVLIVYVLSKKLVNRKSWVDVFLIILLILSWVLNYVGRKVYIGDVRLYFIDFLPTPVILAAGLYWLKSHLHDLNFPNGGGNHSAEKIE